MLKENHKYGPVPHTETHYHIQELIDRQEKRAADRILYRDKEKTSEERDSLIKDAKVVTLTDFFCTQCEKDFKGIAALQVEGDWSNLEQRIAFYRTKCFKGHWCMRLVTDRHRDSYWTRSKAVHRDRGRHFADTIQPHESGFQLLYGRKNTQ